MLDSLQIYDLRSLKRRLFLTSPELCGHVCRENDTSRQEATFWTEPFLIKPTCPEVWFILRKCGRVQVFGNEGNTSKFNSLRIVRAD